MSSGPSRRAVLTAGLTGLLTACTTSKPRPAVPTAPDPDLALNAAAVTRERLLLAAYDAVLAAAPGRTAQLGPLRADHLTHLTALRQVAAPASSARAAPAAGASAPPPAGAALAPPTAGAAPAPPPASAAPAPPTASDGVRLAAQLPALERRAAAAHAAAALTASRHLASLLAALAACESSHLVVLE